jgi:uncharacterized membrane protein
MAIKPLTAALGILTVAYPLVVYFAIGHLEPRHLALLLAVLALARALVVRQSFWWVAAGGACALALLSFAANALLPLKLYPVLVNAVMLAVFGFSLVRPPSVVERLARLAEPDLPDAAVPYTRRVTQVWCGYFIFNGSVALATALWASNHVWALYNGLVSYVLIGLLFGGEWLVRKRVRARLEAAAHG